MKIKSSIKNKVIDLLNGSLIPVSDWDAGECLESPSFLDRWSGTIKIPMQYPFHKKSVIEIEKSPEEIWSTSIIITAIKEKLEYMYSKSVCKGRIPGLINENWDGDFGTSMHSIGDLWIEGLFFNLENGEVKVLMGS